MTAGTDAVVDSAGEVFKWILNNYHDSLFVIDETGRVLFRNAAAARVLRTKRDLAVKAGRIMLGTPGADEALHAFIARSRHPARAGHPDACGIRLSRSGASRDWLVLVKPMERSLLGESSRPLFLVQVIGRLRPRTIPVPALRDLFELTSREVVVVAELLRSGSLHKTAGRLALSHETIRSHLKSIFRKCEVHSKDELMSLLHCISQFTDGT